MRSHLYLIAVLIAPGLFAESRAQENALEEVVVVGSYIRRAQVNTPSPIALYTRDDLISAGIRSLDQLANTTPYSSQSLGDAQRSRDGTAGAANFNLRGLGHDATLTLVNGRRIAAYGQAEGTQSFFDVNAIPVAAIERVEILRDGASALYGSDAVAGVVNIVTRDEIDGLVLEFGAGTSVEGDAEHFDASLAGSTDLRDYALTSVVAYSRREPLFDRDRRYLNDVDFSAYGGENQRSVFSSPPSLQNGPFSSVPDPACPAPFDALAHRGTFGPGFEVCRFNFAQFTNQEVAADRWSGLLSFRPADTHRVNPYGELMYSRNKVRSVLAPDVLFGFAPGFHPDNPLQQDVQILYRPLDVGPRVRDVDSESQRYTLGAEGIAGHWDWDVSIGWSRSEVQDRLTGDVDEERFQQSLFGVGGEGGDQVYNPFGSRPSNAPELLKWLAPQWTNLSRNEQATIDVLTRRALPILNGGLALGAQLRRDSIRQKFDSRILAGSPPGIELDGTREVWAAFGELRLYPFDALEVQLALRYEEYNDFGDTLDPKIGLRWTLTPDLDLRGTYSTSFSAPAFAELQAARDEVPGAIRDEPRCAATGLPEDCGLQFLPQFSSGNPDLRPEEGEAFTTGLVWEPGWLGGTRALLDFWWLSYSDRVVRPDDDPFTVCPEACVVRAPQTQHEIDLGIPGELLSIEYAYLNLDKLETHGVDLDLSYDWTTDVGSFSAGLRYTHTAKYQPQDTVNALAENLAGKSLIDGIPQHRGQLVGKWTVGNHGVTGTIYYVGGYDAPNFVVNDTGVDGADYPVDDWWRVDLQYELLTSKLGTLRIGCRNCLDQAPPTANNLDVQRSSLHDKVGLAWYLRWTLTPGAD